VRRGLRRAPVGYITGQRRQIRAEWSEVRLRFRQDGFKESSPLRGSQEGEPQEGQKGKSSKKYSYEVLKGTGRLSNIRKGNDHNRSFRAADKLGNGEVRNEHHTESRASPGGAEKKTEKVRVDMLG